ncbi:hypothetical protein BDY17DRAFT_313620 [Neohortaea acidophila]|uniref:Uncharacterized protein n=1 Tax=Neohortaea acidophila TaxID=245834 RepID=A0A6A6PGB9_9PEZI|nr:uncharacterized protein BDY17DRAFT_313620 [Neohortaea acidophila]KAF2479020.1 hypothetical protein BDY17DRAFT_313620 [Neohortaea acidophila]
MALSEPLIIQQASFQYGPSFETDPFSVDLLCAKLEVARLEQEAARARSLRQLASIRRDTQHQSHSQTTAWKAEERPSGLPIQDLTVTSPSQPKKRVTRKPLAVFTNTSVGRPANGLSREASDSSTPALHVTRSNPQERTSTFPNQPCVAQSAHRRSLLGKLDANIDDTHLESRQNELGRPCSKDMADRRSKSFPLQVSRSPFKHRSMNAVESTTPAHHTPRDVDDSPTGFACEYTISFDLADDPPYGQTYDHADLLPACPKTQKRDSQPNSPGSYGLRSRSLLNLSGLLKKEGHAGDL